MSMSYVTWFSRDMVAGRGYIGLSANNISGGSLVISTLFSVLFGIADAASNVLQLTNASWAYFVKMIPYIITILGMVIMAVLVNRRRRRMKQRVVEAAIKD